MIGRQAGVRYLVTEAGIGGEFDATNAIARADKISVVMPIGYDHLEILGHELAEIARTKADVIMSGGDVVVAPQPWPEAMSVVTATVDRRRARAHFVADHGADWVGQASAVADRVAELLDDSFARPCRGATRAMCTYPDDSSGSRRSGRTDPARRGTQSAQAAYPRRAT